MDNGVHHSGLRLRAILAQNRTDTGVHTFHTVWGALLLLGGALLFVSPLAGCRAHGLDADSLSQMLAQTTGLIVAVLGVYSFVAGLQTYALRFFRVLGAAYVLTAALLFDLVLRQHVVPPSFGTWAGLTLAVGVTTWHMAAEGGSALGPQWDRLALAQSLHGVLSGAFNSAMLLAPEVVLFGLFPGFTAIPGSDSPLAWAHLMVCLFRADLVISCSFVVCRARWRRL
jgi:hypothetical protein